MKTLQFQSVSAFDRASRQQAQVAGPSDKVCMTVGIIAAVVFSASLGAMCIPAIVASGLTALLAVAVAPSAKKGGES